MVSVALFVSTRRKKDGDTPAGPLTDTVPHILSGSHPQKKKEGEAFSFELHCNPSGCSPLKATLCPP